MYAEFRVSQRLLVVTLSDDFHCPLGLASLAFQFKRGDLFLLTVPLR
jgi:hypothetical protein